MWTIRIISPRQLKRYSQWEAHTHVSEWRDGDAKARNKRISALSFTRETQGFRLLGLSTPLPNNTPPQAWYTCRQLSQRFGCPPARACQWLELERALAEAEQQHMEVRHGSRAVRSGGGQDKSPSFPPL